MCFKYLQSQESSLGKMPGGQEPKEKKRKRPDRREKEKPLLAVQVHNCFLSCLELFNFFLLSFQFLGTPSS